MSLAYSLLFLLRALLFSQAIVLINESSKGVVEIMNDIFNPSEDDFFITDEVSENSMPEESDGDDFFIDSEEEENARYQEIIRELTEFEERYSESPLEDE